MTVSYGCALPCPAPPKLFSLSLPHQRIPHDPDDEDADVEHDEDPLVRVHGHPGLVELVVGLGEAERVGAVGAGVGGVRDVTGEGKRISAIVKKKRNLSFLLSILTLTLILPERSFKRPTCQEALISVHRRNNK